MEKNVLTGAQLWLVNAYVLDPARIAPSRSDATSNGHFPLNVGQNHAGTPRGFSLANMPYMGNNGPVPAGFPGMGMMGMGGPTGWGSGGNMMGELHQPGAMRRGGRFNQRPGPYDRRGGGGGGGGGRYGNASNGRLSPVRGMSLGGRVPGMAGAPFVPAGHPAAAMVGAGFPDANTGAGMAPREAVQGRSLKSYEDLDAVGGGGGGELNY